MDSFRLWCAQKAVILLPWQAEISHQILNRGAASGKRFLVRLLAEFYAVRAEQIKAARMEERERCATMAEDHDDNWPCECQHGDAIAARIRGGG